MSSIRSSSMLLRNLNGARGMRTAPRGVRMASTGGESQPPRSQHQPASMPKQGETKTMLPIAGVGLALGAVFFYLMAKPHNGPEIAHKTGQNLPELTGRDVVDEKTGKRMGTHRAEKA